MNRKMKKNFIFIFFLPISNAIVLSELRSFSRNIRSNQNPCLSSFTVLETCNNSSFQEGSGIF